MIRGVGRTELYYLAYRMERYHTSKQSQKVVVFCPVHRKNTNESLFVLRQSSLYHREKGRARLLANEEHIDSAEIEVVVEGQRGEAIVCGMLTGVELE